MARRRWYSDAVHRLEYAGLVLMGYVVRRMPPRMRYMLCRLLAVLAFDMIRIRRGVTLDNLRHAFGTGMSEEELVSLARRSYVSIGMTFLEILLAPSLRHTIRDVVELDGADLLTRALERGQGLILVSAHFGSWELNGGSLATAGFPLHVVAKPQSNPYVDQLVNDYRGLYGIGILPLRRSMKSLLTTLKNGEVLGLISDQDSGRRGIFVDFFGRPASTPQGAAQIALKYGTPVAVSMNVRLEPGRYRTIVREVEVLPDDTVGSLTRRYTAIIESIIRDHPEQYFWMHRRWKTRPPEEQHRA